MNPFNEESRPVEDNFISLKDMYPKSYDKNKVSPYTKVRVILMNGAEFESNWFLHQFARNCPDNDLKREIALIRHQEQQQQKRISCLKPLNENFLETTISYEQLAIDLTAMLAIREKDKSNKAALDFALLEDFDHLYRFANLLKCDFDIDAEVMVGKLTEIMPGRPTIAEHRHPYDNIKFHFDAKTADPFSKLAAGIIVAAEQQTMNFYMNVSQMYHTDLGRKLFAEIGMIEEQHVTQYESLKDPNCTWLENWLMHEYTECYLYWSVMQDETDKYIKTIWEEHFKMEIAHLKHVANLLKKYEKKIVKDVIPNAEFPQNLTFGSNKEYIRDVILNTVRLTSNREGYIDAAKLDQESQFYKHNTKITGKPKDVASHAVIETAIKTLGQDFRYQDSLHPIEQLNNRKTVNSTVGRVN